MNNCEPVKYIPRPYGKSSYIVKCNKCGIEIEIYCAFAKGKFCTKCGTKLNIRCYRTSKGNLEWSR